MVTHISSFKHVSVYKAIDPTNIHDIIQIRVIRRLS